MKIDYNELEGKFWERTIISMVVGIAGLGCAVGNAYKCGHLIKCKQLDERGFDPEEIFSDEDDEN